MLKTLRQRRRGFVGLGVAVGTFAMVLSMASPAGAANTTSPAQNNVLISGGSNTTYAMMQQLSDLFNQEPGCDLLETGATVQNLDYSCPQNDGQTAAAGTTISTGGENGYVLTYPSVNPYNDVAVAEPALGSGNGIKELEYQGGSGGSDIPTSNPPKVAPLSFARSSRAASNASGGDKEGLNFVAYAEDAVPWFHFTKVGSKKTPSAKVTNLTVAQLTSIYEGNTTNWSAVGGTSAPIQVFMAQSGSGTEGTWVADLGLTGSFPYGGVNATATATGCPASDFEIFENEASSIESNPCTKVVPADAIFFFSYGKYSLLCAPTKGVCPGPGKDTAALGEIGGITASKTTIQNGTFPLDRQLYNVYSDGNNSNLPAVSEPVMNFISTYGFLCKPQTATEVDPLSPTGADIRTEIENIITANGFFPIPLGSEGDNATGITAPSFTDANYAAADPAPSGDSGYCQVTTTDGNGNT